MKGEHISIDFTGGNRIHLIRFQFRQHKNISFEQAYINN